MRDWLEVHKPSGSAKLHLLLAALMWSVVGTALLIVAARRLWQAWYRERAPGGQK